MPGSAPGTPHDPVFAAAPETRRRLGRTRPHAVERCGKKPASRPDSEPARAGTPRSRLLPLTGKISPGGEIATHPREDAGGRPKQMIETLSLPPQALAIHETQPE